MTEVAVEQRVRHQRLDPDVIAGVKIGSGDRAAGSRTDTGDERGRNVEALDLRALVSGLTLEAKEAQLVAGDQIDVVTSLVADVISVVVGRRGRRSCARVVEDDVEVR